MKKKFSLVMAALLIAGAAMADTFTVSSNADAGVGSLRNALTMAGNNGIVITDTILFHIPDTSIAGRTISLQSELPALSSNIIIDGSTQQGSLFAMSGARVILYLDHFTPEPFTYLFIHNASRVKIYGLYFKFFDNPDAGGGMNYAIGLRNSSDIVVGGPGKGNLFTSVRMAITNNYWNYYNDSVKQVTVQANVFGQPGATRGQVDLLNASAVTIGGDDTATGNMFVGAGVTLTQSPDTATPFFVTLRNNRFGCNRDGSIYYYWEGGFANLTGNGLDDSAGLKTIVQDNIFCGSWPGGIGLSNITHRVIVQGNKLNTDISGAVCKGDYNSLGIYNCSHVTVGGYLPGEENILGQGILMAPRGVHIIKNQFGFLYKIFVSPTPSPEDPFCKIISYDNGLIRGKSNPRAVIQLYTDGCNTDCINIKYYQTIRADATGDWSFPYTPGMANIIATATIADSSTSAFSQPIVDHSNFKIKNPTCGKSNGAITGIIVSEGTHLRWQDSYTGKVISTDTNLVNVPAGSYVFIVSNGADGCPWSVNFSIGDVSPPTDVPVITTDASCGQNNGGLQVSSPDYKVQYQWLDARGDSIGRGDFARQLFPGSYSLKLTLAEDTGCYRIYGPFTIVNQRGASLHVSGIQVKAATCGQSNGSITGITVENVSGSSSFQWYDSLNTVVGDGYALQNVSPGKYRFAFKDANGCDTVLSPYYTVPNNGTISIDTANIIITASGCLSASGSIRRLKISGADTYQWLNTSDNSIAGIAAEAFNLAPGNYQLTADNHFGCSKAGPVLVVPPSSFEGLSVTDYAVANIRCGQQTGAINITGLSKDAAGFSFRWVDSLSAQVIAPTVSVTGLPAGSYQLFAKDGNGCEQQIFSARIQALPAPVINYTASPVTDDQCNQQLGGIALTVDGLVGPTSYTWYAGNNTVAGTDAILTHAAAGTYKVAVKDALVCNLVSDPFTIGNADQALAVPVYDDLIIPRNSEAGIQVKNPLDGHYGLYFSSGSQQPVQENNTGNFIIRQVAQDTVVYIRKNVGSCVSAYVAVNIHVVDQSFFTIAHAFTPNGDGLNDELKVKAVGYIALNYFRIYSRWGQLVFETQQMNKGWNGKINGLLQNSGAYVWMAEGKDIRGRVIHDRGSFILVR